MNEYKVNIFADHYETVKADYCYDNEGVLRFFSEEEKKEVATFMKWQYWKKVEENINRGIFDQPCPQRIDRGFRGKKK